MIVIMQDLGLQVKIGDYQAISAARGNLFPGRIRQKSRAKLDLPVSCNNWLRASCTTFFYSWFDEEEGSNVTKLTDFSSKNFQNPPILFRTNSYIRGGKWYAGCSKSVGGRNKQVQLHVYAYMYHFSAFM